MNLKILVKISNVVATISILPLIYWVFIFVTVEVFGLKVFSYNNTKIFLRFDENVYSGNNKDYKPSKGDFIFSGSKQDRDYLNRVFDEGYAEKRFTAHNGKYELFYPYFEGDKKIVLYFSDFQQYGKLGS